MPTIADTGFLFALGNIRDVHHDRTLDIARTLSDRIILLITNQRHFRLFRPWHGTAFEILP
jgi:predicted nucleic acid-binding protein